MPYKDAERQREAKRRSERRRRAASGTGLDVLAEQVQDAADLPEPPSREFLIRALGVQAMQGNVPAIRLLLEEYRRDGNEDTKPAESVVDQLAAKRAARAG